jgi:hypothetical protein
VQHGVDARVVAGLDQVVEHPHAPPEGPHLRLLAQPGDGAAEVPGASLRLLEYESRQGRQRQMPRGVTEPGAATVLVGLAHLPVERTEDLIGVPVTRRVATERLLGMQQQCSTGAFLECQVVEVPDQADGQRSVRRQSLP